MISDESAYVGRFAPSPTGPLHFGSLVAAVGSFLEARSRGGRWLVRIEDVDRPRTVAGAEADILGTLLRLGMDWDGDVLVQRDRNEAYREALETLLSAGVAFACGCSRRDLRGPIYPGTCRDGLSPGKEPRSVRLRTPDEAVDLPDRVQGPYRQHLSREVGDFVVRRADGLFAYQLAVTVDDGAQGITDIVRGSDLLHSTPRQIYLQRLLGLSAPSYAHLPVAVNERGHKLSKQTGAPAVDSRRPGKILVSVLGFLGQGPPPELALEDSKRVWDWAIGHWRMDAVPRARNTNETSLSDDSSDQA